METINTRLKVGSLVVHPDHGIGIVLVAGGELEVMLGDGLRLVAEPEGWSVIRFKEDLDIEANFIEMVTMYLTRYGSPKEQLQKAFQELMSMVRNEGVIDATKK